MGEDLQNNQLENVTAQESQNEFIADNKKGNTSEKEECNSETAVQSSNENQLPSISSSIEKSFFNGTEGLAIEGIKTCGNTQKAKYDFESKKAKYGSESAIAASKNNADADKTRYIQRANLGKAVAEADKMDSEHKSAVLINDSNNNVEIEKLRQQGETERSKIREQEETERSKIREQEETNRFKFAVVVAGVVLIAEFIYKQLHKGGNGNNLKFMTMNDLAQGVPVTSELKVCYIEVDGAIDKLEYLKKYGSEEDKTEAKKWLGLLKKLRNALKALIYKDYVSQRTLQRNVGVLRSLLKEIAWDDNNNTPLSKALAAACMNNEYEYAQLRRQAKEILITIDRKNY